MNPLSAQSSRVALVVEYNGRAYHGWETQKTGPTVQAALEQALSRIATEPVRTICAGRTDSGVHARAQVIHFDCNFVRPEKAWLMGTNTHLPDDIVVRWAGQVSRDFHARFSARRRRYRYVIYNHRVAPGIVRGLVTWECRALNAARMAEGAAYLLGRHDFEAYRARSCQSKTAIRTLYDCRVTAADDYILIDVEANAFLQHMVRNIAGVLMHIGMGKREPRWALQVLQGRDRALGGVTAPPDGLYLDAVFYPDAFQIPSVFPRTARLW